MNGTGGAGNARKPATINQRQPFRAWCFYGALKGGASWLTPKLQPSKPAFKCRSFLANGVSTQFKFKMRFPFHTLIVQKTRFDAGKTRLVAAHEPPHRFRRAARPSGSRLAIRLHRTADPACRTDHPAWQQEYARRFGLPDRPGLAHDQRRAFAPSASTRSAARAPSPAPASQVKKST